jgi:hypothetical protein
MCVCAYVRMCVCAYVRMCVCAYVRMCVCAYVCIVYLCICLVLRVYMCSAYVCIFVVALARVRVAKALPNAELTCVAVRSVRERVRGSIAVPRSRYRNRSAWGCIRQSI